MTDMLYLSALLGCFFLSWRIIIKAASLSSGGLAGCTVHCVFACFPSLNSESGAHHFRDDEMTAQGVNHLVEGEPHIPVFNILSLRKPGVEKAPLSACLVTGE